jgi:hypothetical protein
MPTMVVQLSSNSIVLQLFRTTIHDSNVCAVLDHTVLLPEMSQRSERDTIPYVYEPLPTVSGDYLGNAALMALCMAMLSTHGWTLESLPRHSASLEIYMQKVILHAAILMVERVFAHLLCGGICGSEKSHTSSCTSRSHCTKSSPLAPKSRPSSSTKGSPSLDEGDHQSVSLARLSASAERTWIPSRSALPAC